jgi:DNA-binding PadR family transcriptional regulator
MRVRLWRLRPTTLRVNMLLLLSARRATSADNLSEDMGIPHKVAVQLLTEFAHRGWLDFHGQWSSDSQMRDWYALTDAGWDEVRRHWPMVHRYRLRAERQATPSSTDA